MTMITGTLIRKSDPIFDILDQLCDIETMNQRFTKISNANKTSAGSKTARLIAVFVLGMFAIYSYRQGWLLMAGGATIIALVAAVKRRPTPSRTTPIENYQSLTHLFDQGIQELRSLQKVKSTWMCTILNRPNSRWNAYELCNAYNNTKESLNQDLVTRDNDEAFRKRYQSVADQVEPVASLNIDFWTLSFNSDPIFQKHFINFHAEVSQFMDGKYPREKSDAYVCLDMSTGNRVASPWPLHHTNHA